MKGALVDRDRAGAEDGGRHLQQRLQHMGVPITVLPERLDLRRADLPEAPA